MVNVEYHQDQEHGHLVENIHEPFVIVEGDTNWGLITGRELNNTKDDSVLCMEKPVSEPFKWLRKSGTNGDQSNRDKHSEDKTIALRDVTGGFPFHAPMEDEKQDCKPSNDGLLKADSGCVDMEARHSSAWIGVTPDSGDGANELDDK